MILGVPGKFDDEKDCLTYLEVARWPEGVRCLRCNSERISRFSAKGKTGKIRHLYQCLSCRYQFSATVGTIFHDSHIPLSKWFRAITLICGSNERISTNELSDALEVQYRSASHLAHCIRAVLRGESGVESAGSVRTDASAEDKAMRPLGKEFFLSMVEGREEAKAKPVASAKEPRKPVRRETVIQETPKSVREGSRNAGNLSPFRLLRRVVINPLSLARVPMAAITYLPAYLRALSGVFGDTIASTFPTSIFPLQRKR